MAQVDFGNYQWQNRLLLVFAPLPEHEEVRAQRQLFEGQEAELRERDLIVSYLFQEEGYMEDKALSAEDVTSLRERYGVAEDDFIVLLIGKDGAAKERLEEPIQPADLFAVIDAMPMRQREVEEREMREGE